MSLPIIWKSRILENLKQKISYEIIKISILKIVNFLSLYCGIGAYFPAYEIIGMWRVDHVIISQKWNISLYHLLVRMRSHYSF